ncbi:MAG TPA: phosphotransferase [Methylomirabilota bacterium]|jgi:NDP-sugar pyrophosphorylase family protein/aminoglycoside/choline kinase family phosphotransferase|nr:phosphotransferase [Methylomirabilota bacterium]
MPGYPLAVFLPAAGLGERLRPVTNYLPKPLLPILGKPIIERILERLTAVCDGQIGINLHWKADLLRAWAVTSPWRDRITFFPEDPILGTGGALKNAESFLSGGPFIVHNSDILLDIDFSRLIEEHLSSGNTATLVCHRLPHLSNVVVDGNGQVLDVENPGASKPDPSTIADKVAYTGIAVYSPGILTFLPAGVSHATVAWIAASKAGRKVRAMDFTGCYWNDVGDPTTYARGVLDALREDGETVYLSSAARCGRIELDGYVVLESGSEIRDGSRIRNCIVMPGADVSGRHENGIIGPGYLISLAESDMQPSLHAAEKKRLPLSDPLLARHFGVHTTDARGSTPAPDSAVWCDAILIGLGGSDRRYFRVRHDGRTAVLMECRPEDPDFERHLAYTGFFARHAVPVPELLSADSANKRALFEDLGDTSLYAYLKLPHDTRSVERVYRGVLRRLVTLHTTATRHVHECLLLKTRIFDYDYFRWETTYFLDRFVTGLRQHAITNRPAIDEELHRLSQRVDAQAKGIIHRDFQCQNIMITAGVPRFIDYQGARMAPPAYDVASVLWDPYYRLEDPMRERLLAYYVGEMKADAFTAFDESSFLQSLIPCRLQRHMQALGAYGFLAEVKGKKYFLKHVPEALRLLKAEAAEARREYPELARLTASL